MTWAGRLKFVAMGACLLGAGTAQARIHHASHGSPRSHETVRDGTFKGGAFSFWHGMPISFAASRHETGQYFAEREIGRFGRHASRGRAWAYADGAPAASYGHSSGLQCVAFARSDSGIELSGNADAWWDNAAGVYQRGARPESGSVLNFRSNGAMRLGHVAVVSQVVSAREIEIDHANWNMRGGISRAISVVDVSPYNDWSAVRVALGRSGDYGSIYPTFGFIYNRPDTGRMVTASAAAPLVDLNPAPRDLRGSARDSYDEVAEAPDAGEPSFRRVSYRHHARHRRHRA